MDGDKRAVTIETALRNLVNDVEVNFPEQAEFLTAHAKAVLDPTGRVGTLLPATQPPAAQTEDATTNDVGPICKTCGTVFPSVNEILNQTAPTQPPPDAGEWSQFRFYPKRILNSADGVNGVVVAEAQTEGQAAQIVTEHNAVVFARRSGQGWTLLDWQNWLQCHATTQPDAGEERG